jgi:septum formation protein
MTIFLASRSPRRHQLLQQIGIDFEVIDVVIDEHWDGNELPRLHVERLALEKAQAGKNKINITGPCAILGADTAVVLDNLVLGKAENREQAILMLTQLSGRMHHVYSSVALITEFRDQVQTNVSRVCFRPLSREEIECYCGTEEPIGKAGGYAIQGCAAAFIERLEGSYSGVMGLPLFETANLLRSAGYSVPSLPKAGRFNNKS